MNRTPKFCTSCGTAIKPGSVFCTGCGKRIVADASTANAAIPPQGQGIEQSRRLSAQQLQRPGTQELQKPSVQQPQSINQSQYMNQPQRVNAPLGNGQEPLQGTGSSQVQPVGLRQNANELASVEALLLKDGSLPNYKEALALLHRLSNPSAKASLLLSLAHLYESIDQLQSAIKQVDNGAIRVGAINSFGGTGRLAGGELNGNGAQGGTASSSLANNAAGGLNSNWGQAAVAGVVGGVTSGIVRDMLHDSDSAPMASLDNTFDNVTDELGAMVDDATGAIEDVADGAYEALDDMADGASDFVADLGDEASNVVDDLAHISDEAMDGLAQLPDDAMDTLDDMADGALDGDVLSDASDAVSDASDALGDFFSDLFS